MVGRGYNDSSVGIPLDDFQGRIGYAGGGVAAIGLKQQIVGWKFWNLFLYQFSEFIQGDYQDILFGDKLRKTVVSHPDKGSARCHISFCRMLHPDRLPAASDDEHGLLPEKNAFPASSADEDKKGDRLNPGLRTKPV